MVPSRWANLPQELLQQATALLENDDRRAEGPRPLLPPSPPPAQL